MITTIRDSFKYFIPFLILICLFFIYIQIESSHKSNDIAHVSVSNDEEIQSKPTFFTEDYLRRGYQAADQFRYMNFLSQKYPDLNITYNNKTVSVVIYSNNHPLFRTGSVYRYGNENEMHIPDDFSKLGKYGFEELYIDSHSYHYQIKLSQNNIY